VRGVYGFPSSFFVIWVRFPLFLTFYIYLWMQWARKWKQEREERRRERGCPAPTEDDLIPIDR
jgi:hypothetical protein